MTTAAVAAALHRAGIRQPQSVETPHPVGATLQRCALVRVELRQPAVAVCLAEAGRLEAALQQAASVVR